MTTYFLQGLERDFDVSSYLAHSGITIVNSNQRSEIIPKDHARCYQRSFPGINIHALVLSDYDTSLKITTLMALIPQATYYMVVKNEHHPHDVGVEAYLNGVSMEEEVAERLQFYRHMDQVRGGVLADIAERLPTSHEFQPEDQITIDAACGMLSDHLEGIKKKRNRKHSNKKRSRR